MVVVVVDGVLYGVEVDNMLSSTVLVLMDHGGRGTITGFHCLGLGSIRPT